jgi:sugar/nucleoside kinase (ribokinase family)
MRNGIISSGNWLIDYVKIIDNLPERNMLVNILDEKTSIGGAPHNVLVDLAKLETGIPLFGAGLIGSDSKGDFILERLRENNIDISNIFRTNLGSTSYTDVMTEMGTGNRTFFHYKGTNALLDLEHFLHINTEARIFHLAYLLLLDKLDSSDPEYGILAARVLHFLQKSGYKTSVDVVSEQSDRYKKIVFPCLKYINYLVLNEIEAGNSTGFIIREPDNSLNIKNIRLSAESLINGGVSELVVIHFPEGSYALNIKKEEFFVPSFIVDEKNIKGTVGAGDAFCAGILYGIHENISLEETLVFANANAALSLFDLTSTGGAVPLQKVREFISSQVQREKIINTLHD